MKKIILTGNAGQGIKLLGYLLAATLSHFDYYVTLTYNYDSAVRTGNIAAYLIYDNKPIKNPMIDKADLVLILGYSKEVFPSKEKIIEKNICDTNCINCSIECKNIESVPFQEQSIKEFKTKKQINMIALGNIIKKIGLNLNLDFLKKNLPKNFIEENAKAIKLGYNYKSE